MTFYDMSCKSTETSHETSFLRSVRKKIRRKMSILKLRSGTCKEVSQEMLVVLMLQNVSSWVAGFQVPSQCLASKHLRFEGFKTGGNAVLSRRRGTS